MIPTKSITLSLMLVPDPNPEHPLRFRVLLGEQRLLGYIVPLKSNLNVWSWLPYGQAPPSEEEITRGVSELWKEVRPSLIHVQEAAYRTLQEFVWRIHGSLDRLTKTYHGDLIVDLVDLIHGDPVLTEAVASTARRVRERARTDD